MSLEGTTEAIIALARESREGAIAIAFLLAFGESLAFVSLFVPATFILAAFAMVLGAGGIDFWPAWFAAGLGAAFGYSLSYWIGFYFKDRAHDVWPFSRNPNLITRGRTFIERYGPWAAFLGHFFGPARASVPVVAGILAMRHIPFQLANIPASFLWSAAVLAPGQIGLPWLMGH
jgi:membrane protein DedA with SNARE-associated domain